MAVAKERMTQLDGIRALAIAAVFLHHAFQVPMLWMGVDLFFILSGFLITGILLSTRHRPAGQFLGSFYRRRAVRILPPYAVLLIFASLVLGIGSWIHHFYLYIFLMNVVVALQIPHPHSLMVLWSLAVEEQFYLFWPLVILGCEEVAVGYIAVALLLIAPALRWFCTPLFESQWPIYALPPFRMDCLAAGALLCVIWRRRPNLLHHYGAYGIILPILSLAGLLWLEAYGITTSRNTQIGNTLIYEFSLWGCFGVMTWALSGRAIGILKLSPLTYLGRISYTVYLTHLLILSLCAEFFTRTFAVAGAALCFTLAFASASWFLLEKPLLYRWSRRRKATPTSISTIP